MATTAGNTATTRVERLAWLEPTKGVAMFMVVVYHSTLYLQSTGVDAVLGRAKLGFELFPMPAFFLIAGMFTARHARYSFSELWRRRLLSLLYLYVLWSVIRTVFYFLIPGLNGELGEIPATDPLALPLILLWPSSSYWFLYALFLFTLLRWLIAGLSVRVQLATSGIVSTLFTAGTVDAGNIGWNRVGGLFFFFVLGAVCSRQIRNLIARARLIHCGIAVAVSAAVTALLLLGLRWMPMLVLTGQLAAVTAGILVCARLCRFRFFKVFNTLGLSSLKVYLLHLYIIVPAAALVGRWTPEWSRPLDVVVQLALIAGAVLGSLAIARMAGGVRWLYLPPAFLRGTRRGGGFASGAPRDRRPSSENGDRAQHTPSAAAVSASSPQPSRL